MNVYERIDLILKERGISRRKLAEISGIPYSTIASSFSRKSKKLSIETIDKIAIALGVPIVQIMENITWEQHKDTNEMKALDRVASAMNGIVAVLADIYGKVEEKTIDDSMYYLVGEGDNSFTLSEDALNKLYSATRASIPHMVDLLKKSEKQEIQELLNQDK